MKKTKIQTGCRLLVESILKNDLVTANDLLYKLLLEAEAQREDKIEKIVLEQEADDATEEGTADAEGDAEGDTEGGDEAGEEEGEEPEDNDTELGDDLEDATGEPAEEEEDDENVVGNAKLTELGNDEIELQCQINEKMISIYADQLANLKTQLNALGLEKQEREYVTLEMNISYYSKKLRELQDKCEITVDQDEVKERLEIVKNAIATLKSQIESEGAGGADDVPDVDSTDELNDDAEETDEGDEEAAEAEEADEGDEKAAEAEEADEGEEELEEEEEV